jgi:aminotransferase in exopolysaccharide biosynthesis
MQDNFPNIVSKIRELYGEGFIPLHAPYFGGNEKKYLNDCIDSTFVSSVGQYVNLFEQKLAEFTGAKYAVATVNGTSALHISLILAGVEASDEVLTQALTFVATANAISYIGASPIFIDVDRDTMGLSPEKLEKFLEKETFMNADGFCCNKSTGKRIKACVPMHTFGIPLRIEEIVQICKQHNIIVVEDTAESLGSYVNNIHTGNFGQLAAFSFNGNKTITCGGGGAIITNDETLAKRAKHLTTTAKSPHPFEFFHDEIGFNYRMPNLNAAVACAQLEQLDLFLENKRITAEKYSTFFKEIGVDFVNEITNTKANYWLNAIVLKNKEERDSFISYTNEHEIMTRPIWTLMNRLPAFKHAQTDDLINSYWLEERVVNIPSSYRQ